MSRLPSGTITFLFTDIEASTRLVRELGERYPELLEEHRRLLRAAFERRGGVEIGTEGDSFFVAFESASDAVEAARCGQAALGDGPVRVRMGLHSGEAMEIEEGYAGISVHRAARISSAAHGGQVVLSEQTLALAEVDGPVRDLGRHRLKDLGEPERLYQLGGADFPPLRSLNATNLPAQPTPLIGRSGEVARAIELMRSEDVRLLTLTGAGGSGKTRLALQVAAELVDDFVDGVFWVPLSALGEPAFVLPTIGRTLGATNGVAEHVDEKRMLLLLDNFEHVLAVAPDLSELLASCQNLHLLVTSRAVLRIAAEREFEVPPLPERDAVSMFVDRARAIRPDLAPMSTSSISAIAWTVSHSRSSSPRRAFECSRPSSSRRGSSNAYRSLRREPGTPRRASGRCGRRSIGATTCSGGSHGSTSPASRSSPGPSPWKRQRRYAMSASAL